MSARRELTNEEKTAFTCPHSDCAQCNGTVAKLEAAVDKVLSKTISMPEDMKKLYGIDALELTKGEL